MKALRLPMIYAISNADAIGVKSFMKQLDVALRKGLRFLQLREKNISAKELRGLARNAVALAHEFGAVVTVNSHIELAIESGADGVHFTSRQLYENETRPDVALLGASCHNAEELELAVKIGADFVVLGPLNTTPSHAALSSLGWENFSELIGNFPLPALAIGGLQATDLTEAWKHGAHGIAMLRAAWPEIKPVTLMPAEVSV